MESPSSPHLPSDPRGGLPVSAAAHDREGAGIGAPDDTAGDPVDAVHRWWHDLATGDLDRFADGLHEQYVVVGGPDGRTIGRMETIRQAAAFVGTAEITSWAVADLHAVRVGDVAVCTYRWEEEFTMDDHAQRLRGWATDVVHHDGGRWVHRARHVSADS